MTSEQKEAFLNSWFGSLPECSGHWTHGMSGNLVDEVNARFDEAIQAYTRAVPDVAELVRYDPNNKIYPYFEMEESELGEYVRYDQDAAMLAAKDVVIEKIAELQKMAFRRAEAAEAELAQIKAQVPVKPLKWGKVSDTFYNCWVHDFGLRYCIQQENDRTWSAICKNGLSTAFDSYQHKTSEEAIAAAQSDFNRRIAIYAAPVAREDKCFECEGELTVTCLRCTAPVYQTEEIERLREAAQKVIDRWDTPNWKEAAPTADAINNLRSALSENWQS